MWNKIPPQHSICPSSLASRACLSHRRRPSTFSLAAFGHGAPPNKWLISHGCRFSEVCLGALFSLIISAFSLCPLHPVSPVLRGRALKKKATRRSVHTQMTLTDIKRPQAITSDHCCLYVSSVSSAVRSVSVAGHIVSEDTPTHPWNILEDERMQSPRVGRRARGRGRGELDLTGSVTEKPYTT